MGSNGKLPQHGKISTYVKHKCRCVECVTYYKEHRKARRLKDSEKDKIYRDNYYKSNREYFLQKGRERVFTEAQKEIARERSRQWRKDNKEYAAVRDLAYNRANPEIRKAVAARRRASEVTMDSLDKTLSSEYRKAISKDPCYYCGNYSNVMHDDHYFPIVKGGTDHWFNLVRSCQPCNNTKYTKCGTSFKLRGNHA